MRVVAILGFVGSLVVAFSAGAADLIFALQGDTAYDDNVFRSDGNEEDDVLLRLRPEVRLQEDRGDDLNYRIGYEVPIEFAIENNEELQDLDHIVRGTASYHVTDRLTFFGSDDLRFLRSTLGRAQTNLGLIGDTLGVVTVQGNRDRVTLNDATVGMSYRITPRLVTRLSASSEYFETTREDRSDNYSITGFGDVRYRLNPHHQIGGGLRYTLQEFRGRDDLEGSTSNTYGAFVNWLWLITDTLSFEAQGGPSYIETEQDTSAVLRVRRGVPVGFIGAAVPLPAGIRNSAGAVVSSTGANGGVLVPAFSGCGTEDGIPVESRCSFLAAGSLFLDSMNDQGQILTFLNTFSSQVNRDPSGEEDSGLDFFVNATLRNTWTPGLNSALRYTRQQGNASGLGSTVVADIVALSTTWDFLERWQLTVRGEWSQQRSTFSAAQTFDQVFASVGPGGAVIATLCGGGVIAGCPQGTAFNADRTTDIDTQRWGGAIRVTHRLFRNTRIFVQGRYDQQESDNDSLGSGSDFENIIGSFGVRHTFEPITVW